MARVLGFEPRFTESKSVVLPVRRLPIMAGSLGLEPRTARLTVGCTTTCATIHYGREWRIELLLRVHSAACCHYTNSRIWSGLEELNFHLRYPRPPYYRYTKPWKIKNPCLLAGVVRIELNSCSFGGYRAAITPHPFVFGRGYSAVDVGYANVDCVMS